MTQQVSTTNEPQVYGQAGLPFLYVSNLQVSVASNTTLNIATGQCRNSTNAADIVIEETLTLNAATTGVNALDTGTFAASTVYAVYVISDPSGFLPTASLMSTSATSPTLPFGYGWFRRIGWAISDGSTHFINVRNIGTGNLKKYIFDELPQVLNAGAATSYTAIDLTPPVPAIATMVTFNYIYTPASASNAAQFRYTGSSANPANAIKASGAAAVEGQIVVTSAVATGNASIDYKVVSSDTLSLFVYSFEDYL